MKKNILKLNVVVLLLTTTFFSSCRYLDDGATISVPGCNEKAVLDNVKFPQVATENYVITNVVLNNDCLEITLNSSGCDPDNWDMNLIGVRSLAAVYPPEVNTKIELQNKEACLAVFQKTVSFDVIPYRIPGQNQVRININGWNTGILYQY